MTNDPMELVERLKACAFLEDRPIAEIGSWDTRYETMIGFDTTKAAEMIREWVAAEGGPWKCYQCSEVFWDHETAGAHFSGDMCLDDAPWCFTVKELERLQDENPKLQTSLSAAEQVAVSMQQALAEERNSHHNTRVKLRELREKGEALVVASMQLHNVCLSEGWCDGDAVFENTDCPMCKIRAPLQAFTEALEKEH